LVSYIFFIINIRGKTYSEIFLKENVTLIKVLPMSLMLNNNQSVLRERGSESLTGKFNILNRY